MKQINTEEYWERRFSSGDWADNGGPSQTRAFAEAQIPRMGLTADFNGLLCDFGCGAGDGFPAYREAWPKAKLVGVDFSSTAIRTASARFGHIGDFLCGDYSRVPECDVVVASNVLEHLEDDKRVARELKNRCNILYIVVPYREPIAAGQEHVNRYDDHSFDLFEKVETQVFLSKGWSFIGAHAIKELYVKNAARWALRRTLVEQRWQIMYRIY